MNFRWCDKNLYLLCLLQRFTWFIYKNNLWIYPAGIRRCFDVDIRLKKHRDVDNEMSTLFQRCFNVVLKTLHQRYRNDVVSTWNQGWFFDVNWQPKFNVVLTLFLVRCINVVELTLFQRGIRVDFSSTSLIMTLLQRLAIDARTICIFNIFTTSFRRQLWRCFNVVSTSFFPLGI